jgi:hypothetical protein
MGSRVPLFMTARNGEKSLNFFRAVQISDFLGAQDSFRQTVDYEQLLWNKLVLRCFRWNTARTEAPSPKRQAPKKLHISRSKPRSERCGGLHGGALRFGAWNFSGTWCLGFGASRRSDSIENSEEPINSALLSSPRMAAKRSERRNSAPASFDQETCRLSAAPQSCTYKSRTRSA